MIDANSQFFAILTKVGEAKQANADALGIPWLITQMGVGDANGTDPVPDRLQTKLVNEWRRRPLNQLKIDPANEAVIIAEQIIPADEGGKWIREIGLYDADGDLVAVANCAPSFKPVLSQGSGRTQVVRMNFIVTNSGSITLKIDPSVVLATREYVDGLTGRASQADAEKGEDSLLIMTPLRVFQAIAKIVRQATETASGWAKISTQDQVAAGVNDATIVTPKKLRAGFAINLAQNGYLAFPTWLGGLIFQWGRTTYAPAVAANAELTMVVNYPIAFPGAVFIQLCSCQDFTASSSGGTSNVINNIRSNGMLTSFHINFRTLLAGNAGSLVFSFFGVGR